MPEHRVNVAGDQCPILGTDVSTAAKVFGRHVVSRTVFDIDYGQDLDRRGHLRAGRHLVA